LINGVGTEFIEIIEELPDIDVMILKSSVAPARSDKPA
jgi:hypothetical protein